MINFRYKMIITCAAAIVFLSCSDFSNWRQFHGDLPNHGFQLVNSEYAISPEWISESNPITSSSPVIGKGADGNEVVYVGATNGKLIALDAEGGSEKWSLFFGGIAGGIIWIKGVEPVVSRIK